MKVFVAPPPTPAHRLWPAQHATHLSPVVSPTSLLRCIAIVAPLRRLDWMTASAARRRVVPATFLCAFLYMSYKSLVVMWASPGILACNSVAGTSVLVSQAGDQCTGESGREPVYW